MFRNAALIANATLVALSVGAGFKPAPTISFTGCASSSCVLCCPQKSSRRGAGLCVTLRFMKRLVGLLYIATGILCELVQVLFVGSMLGISAPAHRISGLFLPGLFNVGSSLLILSGVAILIPTSRRLLVCIATSVILMIGVASWSGPKIGWHDATWLLLEPELVSLVLATIALLLLRKAWLSALAGSILAAPFFMYGVTWAVQDFFASSPQLWLIGPASMLVLCMLAALCIRTD